MVAFSLHLKRAGDYYHAGDYRMEDKVYEDVRAAYASYSETGEPKYIDLPDSKVFRKQGGQSSKVYTRSPLLIPFENLGCVG